MTDEIDYAPVIAELERKRDEIDRTIATLRALAGMSVVTEAPEGVKGTAQATLGPLRSSGSGPGSGLRRDQFFGMKAPEAVKAYLAAVRQPRGAARIASDLVTHGFTTTSEAPANSIRTTLRRLEVAGEVVQVKKEWGLTEWYPGLRNKRTKATAEGSEAES